MVGNRVVRGSLRYSSLLWLLGVGAALGACTSVLGIEELHDGPRPGSAGDNASGGTSSTNGGKNSGGGADSTAGTDNNGGTNTAGGTNPTGGTNNGGTSNGGTNTGGSANEGGAGGEPVNTDPTVHGTLIDFWGHPLVNQVVNIGDQQIATDKFGKFTAENVPATYDVTMSFTRNSGDFVYAWCFQGLTRRDPTLQVYQALENSGTTGYVKVAATPSPGPNDAIAMSLGTPDGTRTKASLAANDQFGNYFDPDWQGPASTSGMAHALYWTKNNSTTLPSAYKAFDSKLVALAEGTPLDYSFTLTAGDIVSKNVDGTVAPTGKGDRTNSMFLRFDTGDAIELANHTPPANTFSYLAPVVPKGSITIAASEDSGFTEPYAIVHKDGLNPGDAAGTLTIPAAATPTKPSTVSDMVDNTTEFSFVGSGDNKGGFVIHIEANDYNQYFYIVTAQKKFTLPDVSGFLWVPARDYRWRIETHGDYATVDQMTGPNGFVDSFAGATALSYNDAPAGPRMQSGSFTRSKMAYFTRK